MKTAANIFYFFAYRNAFQSYLQMDSDADMNSSTNEIESNEVFENVNCIHKHRIKFEQQQQQQQQQAADTQSGACGPYDMIYIAGKGFALKELLRRVEFAKQRLTKRGVIVFDYANPPPLDKAKQAEFGCAWQVLSRLRCDSTAFACVVDGVGHGCAVYRPNCRSIAFASQHLSQYDKLEYLQENRALLLNLISWETFLTLIRFF